jgi:hypothetical protein
MRVRLRLRHGPRVNPKSGRDRQLALALSGLLKPAVLMALALAVWRLLADLGSTRQFGIAAGLFSHWQVWLAVAGLLAAAAWRLGRYGHSAGLGNLRRRGPG